MTANKAPFLAPVFALLISGGLLVGAWTFQYGFDYPPCTMCYWQRHAHKIVLLIAGISLALSAAGNRHIKLFNYLIALATKKSKAPPVAKRSGISSDCLWRRGTELSLSLGQSSC